MQGGSKGGPRGHAPPKLYSWIRPCDHAIYSLNAVSHQSECDSGFVSVADPWCEGAIWGSGGCAPSGVQAPGAVPLVRGSGAKPP